MGVVSLMHLLLGLPGKDIYLYVRASAVLGRDYPEANTTMASPSSEGPGSQEKLPRSTPKRLSNSRTWSSPRNMDWLKEDDADSAESASPAVSPGSRVFFLGI